MTIFFVWIILYWSWSWHTILLSCYQLPQLLDLNLKNSFITVRLKLMKSKTKLNCIRLKSIWPIFKPRLSSANPTFAIRVFRILGLTLFFIEILTRHTLRMYTLSIKLMWHMFPYLVLTNLSGTREVHEVRFHLKVACNKNS